MTPKTYLLRLESITRAYFGSAVNGAVAIAYRNRVHIREHEYVVTLELVGPREAVTATETQDGLRVGLEGTGLRAVLARKPVRAVGRELRTGRYARVFRLEFAVFVDYDAFSP